MSKTAEEILKDNTVEFGNAIHVHMVHKAMREFAAQEVEAYKERLKKDCDVLLGYSMASDVIKTLIDTVK